MLYSWLYPLKSTISMFNVFRYITVRSAIAAIIAFIFCLAFYPMLIRFLRVKLIGQVIRDDGPKTHYSKKGTPTMGGILICISMLISIAIAGNFTNPYTMIFVIGILLFSSIGFLDDYLKVVKKNSKGLIARKKMIALVFASVFISYLFFYFTPVKDSKTFLSIHIPFINLPIVSLSYYYMAFSSFILIGFSNAVNLNDGLDGLAAGLVLIVGMVYALFTYITGHVEVAAYLKIPYMSLAGETTVTVGALIGAVAGFLWYNSHPAEIIMGDTGSILLGGVIGMFSLITKTEILLVIIGGVFVITTLSVIIQVIVFKLTGKRVFLMAPIHHHFELKGWPESKVIIRFWIIGAVFAIIALATLKIR